MKRIEECHRIYCQKFVSLLTVCIYIYIRTPGLVIESWADFADERVYKRNRAIQDDDIRVYNEAS